MALSELERASLASRRSGEHAPAAGLQGDERLLEYALSTTLEAIATVRAVRLLPLSQIVEFKADHSPVTRFEREIEIRAKERLRQLDEGIAFVGEESGGQLPAKGLAVALDPVDGTWALLNRTATCAVSLTIYRDGQAIVGVVANPATGEVGYVLSGTRSRLLQPDLMGEGDQACDLPLDRTPVDSVLVNVHPQRHVARLVGALVEAWREDGLNMVRMAGGSPALGLLDAAKGSFVYVNTWGRGPSVAYDLGAGLELVRGAGGDVIDLRGEPIDAIGHEGLFIAGLEAEARDRVRRLAQQVLDT
jgi:fructose-1,6-bisphosphatase/inositol monophosphatase family enzyme